LKWVVSRGAFVALLACEFDPEVILATLFGNNPGTHLEGWIVADVLRMSASEIRDPVCMDILVKTNHPLKHQSVSGQYPNRFPRQEPTFGIELFR